MALNKDSEVCCCLTTWRDATRRHVREDLERCQWPQAPTCKYSAETPVFAHFWQPTTSRSFSYMEDMPLLFLWPRQMHSVSFFMMTQSIILLTILLSHSPFTGSLNSCIHLHSACWNWPLSNTLLLCYFPDQHYFSSTWAKPVIHTSKDMATSASPIGGSILWEGPPERWANRSGIIASCIPSIQQHPYSYVITIYITFIDTYLSLPSREFRSSWHRMTTRKTRIMGGSEGRGEGRMGGERNIFQGMYNAPRIYNI